MTLDEAIEHAKEVARICEDSACAADHMQLAEWLRQARGAEDAAKWYTKKIRELEDERERMFKSNVEKNNEILRLLAENAKLKEELEAVGTAAYLYGRSDLKIENAKLRELIADVHEALCADKAGMFHKLTLASMEDDMRELGIEEDA